MKKSIFGGVLAFALTAAISIVGGFGAAAAGTAMNSNGTANLKVADISHYQTVSNWAQAASNLDAIYIKATEGATWTDPKYSSFASSAQSVNLDYGFYHYFWPYPDTSSAVAQADYFYNAIKGYSYTCVPALDVEITNGMTKAQITADINSFAAEFKRLSGHDIMIYTNSNFIDANFGSSLSAFKLWVANYNSGGPQVSSVWSQWTMWQYTENGTVSGIGSGIDCNKATDSILLSYSEMPKNSISGDGYSLTIDKYYTSSNGIKSFNATASLNTGMLMMVSTLGSGEQEITYQSIYNTSQTYNIPVNSNAYKTAVYLVNSNCNGTAVPRSYGLVQFVTEK